MKNEIELLQELIKTPSFSGQEEKTAEIIEKYLVHHDIEITRIKNNVLARSKNFLPHRPSILLNSHHDTVKINEGWTKDPFAAIIEGDLLYGRGSNDAGGPLVALIATFIEFYNRELPFNLVLAATAEEENFGPNGLELVLNTIDIDFVFGIIGEPTSLEIAVAQKGLIVIDGSVLGKAGHAARNTGINAIYQSLTDLQKISQHTFSKVSDFLGPTTVQLTQINAGSQHNVVPDLCKYVLDVRVNELYTLEEAFQELDRLTYAQLTPRSLRWHSRGLPKNHPIFKIAKSLKWNIVGSPTLSDQVHCSFPTIKMGPGDSPRSHTADEFIKITEIKAGIKNYTTLIEELSSHPYFNQSNQKP